MFVVPTLARCVRLDSRILQRPVRQVDKCGCRQFRQKTPKQTVVEDNSGLVPVSMSALVRPALFTVAFSGAAVGVCAVWQYENMRTQALRSKLWGQVVLRGRKAGEWREQIREWWARQSEGHKVFWPVASLNLLVFMAWKVPQLDLAMKKWFLCNPGGRATCLPLLLSTFSHYSLLHLGVNMFVLHSLAPPMVHLMGKEQFLAVYLTGGVVSSLTSSLAKVARGRMSFSLGASGAIMTVLGIFGTLAPDSRMQIVLLPMFTFSAATAIKCLAVADLTGLVVGWRLFDHAAHLGGLLVGVGWCYYGNRLVWEKREGLVTFWHNFRDRNRRD